MLSNVQVSPEDEVLLEDPMWHISNNGYVVHNVRQNGKWKKQQLHRLIAERTGLNIIGNEIDHIDRNRLNNKRENLRVATRRQNNCNSSKPKGTSGFRGVTVCRDRWMAQISCNYRKIHLGRFDSALEAHHAYCKAAKELHGPFALTE